MKTSDVSALYRSGEDRTRNGSREIPFRLPLLLGASHARSMIGYTCKECTTIIQKSVLEFLNAKRSRFQPMVIPNPLAVIEADSGSSQW